MDKMSEMVLHTNELMEAAKKSVQQEYAEWKMKSEQKDLKIKELERDNQLLRQDLEVFLNQFDEKVNYINT
jgi:hypothetical protein